MKICWKFNMVYGAWKYWGEEGEKGSTVCETVCF